MASLVARLASFASRSVAVAYALGLAGCQVAAQLPATSGGRQVASSRSVIVQLFEWRWSDVAQECETWLGPYGYGAVQISPPHEHRVIAQETMPFPWYQRYEPVSYRLSSRSGNRAALANMVSRCHSAGVDVYADVVINSLALANDSTAQMVDYSSRWEGSQGVDDDTLDISSDLTDPYATEVYDNAEAATRAIHTSQLDYPQDLDTGSEQVQAAITAAMNELLSLGVAGFRIDAAHRIPPQHLAKILRRLHPLNSKFHPEGGRPFIYQAVSGTDAAQPSDYFSNGAVTEFRYGRNLGEQILYGELKNLVLFGEAWGLIPSHKAIVFTDNHITQRSRDRNIVTFYAPADNGASYRLANIFMLAWPYGTPKIMSSYDWPREQGNWVGPPADAQGQTLPVNCGDGWVCEHRWSDIANMVEFRNVTQGNPSVIHWWDNGNNQIAFARGNRGFVVINNDNSVLSETLMTGLPAGSYCNILSKPTSVDSVGDTLASCDTVIVVDTEGNATFAIAPQQAVALHIKARL
ncbi:alpha 1a [Leptolyngbya sp. Heron Island J]|uniref:alpha-amylase n=1 Tax=Leptolyngbya sp. Heron Island J TaxID=1385935 RepID=UPI0003B9608A|nr:alpha-amylase family protein [Leptolyngbya sp. Heron Island J]ESA36237.1 alpha 1a [Leptolyngbya sp. Heron Island J]